MGQANMKQKLQEELRQAVERAATDGIFTIGTLPDIELTEPPDKKFGDYATNLALQLTRQVKKPPRVIAEVLMSHIDGGSWLDRVEIAGPGFINFYLKPSWLYNVVQEVITQGDRYGCCAIGQGQKVQVEFVSANPTGLLHVGHGRGAAVGSALVNLLRMAGYDVKSEYYINDAGNQVNNLALSVDVRYHERLGQPMEFPDGGYHGQDIIDTAQIIVDKYGDQYLRMPADQRLERFKEMALQEKMVRLMKDLKEFGVEYDVWFSERKLHDNCAIDQACEQLQAQGYLYEQDGAQWLRSTAFGDDKDRVVIRDNGVPTYLAADIAYHRNKFERGFDKVINLWGADHHGYVPRMHAAIQALGYQKEQLEVIILQMVSLYRNGELVKMSKRTGQSVTLTELIEEVGKDAARFFFIMRSSDSQLDFDLDLATSESNDNPVYYVQYGHARVCSIFRQAVELGVQLQDLDTIDMSVLRTEVEQDLLRQLQIFPEEVAEAARRREPHKMARYALDLAGLFHSFYNSCRVLKEETAVQQARLALVTAVGIVLKNTLGILGVSAPQRM